jgi:hypothetical protein
MLLKKFEGSGGWWVGEWGFDAIIWVQKKLQHFFLGSPKTEEAKNKSNYVNQFGPRWLAQGYERIEN